MRPVLQNMLNFLSFQSVPKLIMIKSCDASLTVLAAQASPLPRYLFLST